MLADLREALYDLGDGRTRARRRIENVFSREVFGSLLVSLALSKSIETGLAIVAPGRFARLVGWLFMALLFVAIFAYWEGVASTATKAADVADAEV